MGSWDLGGRVDLSTNCKVGVRGPYSFSILMETPNPKLFTVVVPVVCECVQERLSVGR